MEWRIIPGLEAYEITPTGRVRKRGSRYGLTLHGRKYVLRNGMRTVRRSQDELTALAYPAVDEVCRLRARVAELETALEQTPKSDPAKPKAAAKARKDRPCSVCLAKFTPRAGGSQRKQCESQRVFIQSRCLFQHGDLLCRQQGGEMCICQDGSKG